MMQLRQAEKIFRLFVSFRFHEIAEASFRFFAIIYFAAAEFSLLSRLLIFRWIRRFQIFDYRQPDTQLRQAATA
jgi:hypothetical protein